jgi:hypothetical protein
MLCAESGAIAIDDAVLRAVRIETVPSSGFDLYGANAGQPPKESHFPSFAGRTQKKALSWGNTCAMRLCVLVSIGPWSLGSNGHVDGGWDPSAGSET